MIALRQMKLARLSARLQTFTTKIATGVVMLATISVCMPANAQIYNWGPDPFDNVYHNILNWTPVGFADTTSEAAVIGFANFIDPKLFANVTLGGLTINAAGSLDQNGFALTVNPGPPGYIGLTNLKHGGEMWIRSGAGAFDTESLVIAGFLRNRGGFIQVDTGAETRRPQGWLEGFGTFQMAGSQPFVNHSLVWSNGVNTTLTINRIGTSVFDWDGDGGGELEVGANSTLRINMPVSGAFGNNIFINEDGVFRVDPAWTLDGGTIELNGGRIEGGAFSVTGNAARINTTSSSRIDSAMTMNAGQLNVNSGFLQFTGNATLGGSADVNIQPGTRILIDELFESNGAEIVGNELNVRIGGMFVMADGELNLSTLDVDAGAIFEMNGGRLVADAVEGNLEIDGGILAIGSSAGHMTVDGDFDQRAGASLEIELAGFDAGSQFDQMTVTGDVSIAGSLDVQLIEPFVLGDGQQFTIIDVTGSLTGVFAGLADGDLVGEFNEVDLFISYTSNSVVLFTPPVDPKVLLGDVNLDEVVNLLDVSPFIQLLSAGMFQAEADVNQDGLVNLLDVQPFIELLSGG